MGHAERDILRRIRTPALNIESTPPPSSNNPQPQSQHRPNPNHPPTRRVEGLHSKVKEVYAGSVHSCVLTREGTVYAFGKHEYTGHGDQEDVLEPRLIPIFSGGDADGSGGTHLVRQISVGPGGYHTMALTCQVGCVVRWGRVI